MKKKLIILLLSFAATLCCAFAFSACFEKDDNNQQDNDLSNSNNENEQSSENSSGNQGASGECNHVWGDWQVITKATCVSEGEEIRYCKLSSLHYEKRKTEIDPDAHTYAESNQCLACSSVWDYTQNLKYTLNESNNSYSVSGIGNSKEAKIVLPYGYKGLPVTAIDEGAFADCENLTSIFLNKNITSIGDEAFANCTNLESITFQEGLNSIGNRVFTNCLNLKNIFINSGNNFYYYEDGILYNRNKTEIKCVLQTKKSVTIPDNVFIIDDYALYGYTNLESISLSDKIHTIGDYAFYGCKNLESITLHSIYSMGQSAFGECTDLKTVTIENGDYFYIFPEIFKGCINLESINIIRSEYHYSIIDGIIYNKEMTELLFVPKKITSVVVPDSVTSISYEAFADCTSIESVTMGNGFTFIDLDTFKDCINLTSISIGSGVTEIYGLGYGSLDYVHSSLESFAVDANNPVYSSRDGILYDKNITQIEYVPKAIKGDITIPDSVVTPICDNSAGLYFDGSAFHGRANIEGITIGNGITFIDMGTFEGCTNLKRIDTGNSVTSIYMNAFRDCINLASISIGSGVTEIYGLGYGSLDYVDLDLASLESITVDANNSEYASQDGILYDKNMTKIEYVPKAIKGNVTIPDSVTYISDEAFKGRTQIIQTQNGLQYVDKWIIDCDKTVTSVTLKPDTKGIADKAFYGCKNITSISLPSSITAIGYEAFEGCENLTGVYITDLKSWFNIEFYSNPLSMAHNLYLNDKLLTSLVIPTEITKIKNLAFDGCYCLERVIIHENITSIDYEAFRRCVKLIEVVNLSKLSIVKEGISYGYVAAYAKNVVNSAQESKIKNLDGYIIYENDETVYLLGYEGNDTELQLPDKLDGKNYKIYYYAFYNDNRITKITIPASVTFLDYSFSNENFAGCTNLESITVDANNPEYSSQDGILYDKNKKYLIRVPAAKTSVTIPNGVTSISSRAFKGCTKLTSITIPDSITSIGSYAFSGTVLVQIQDGVHYVDKWVVGCDNNVTSVNLRPDTKGIADCAFWYCTSLKNITIPNSVTYIGVQAFEQCSNLTSITVPDSVTFIGSYAFNDCTSLTSVTFENTVGWEISMHSDMFNAQSITVDTPTENAIYLKSIYNNYYWRREA